MLAEQPVDLAQLVLVHADELLGDVLGAPGEDEHVALAKALLLLCVKSVRGEPKARCLTKAAYSFLSSSLG
jgi:hypothetical protein